jgi:hypothetical protein
MGSPAHGQFPSGNSERRIKGFVLGRISASKNRLIELDVRHLKVFLAFYSNGVGR